MAEQPAVLLDDKWTEWLRTFEGREQLLTWAFEYLQVQTSMHQVPKKNRERIAQILELVKSCPSHQESAKLVLNEVARMSKPKPGPLVNVILQHRDGTPVVEGRIPVAEGLTPPIGFNWMPSLVVYQGKVYKLMLTPQTAPYIYRDVMATEVQVP